jgi:hypothetical protein
MRPVYTKRALWKSKNTTTYRDRLVRPRKTDQTRVVEKAAISRHRRDLAHLIHLYGQMHAVRLRRQLASMQRETKRDSYAPIDHGHTGHDQAQILMHQVTLVSATTMPLVCSKRWRNINNQMLREDDLKLHPNDTNIGITYVPRRTLRPSEPGVAY